MGFHKTRQTDFPWIDVLREIIQNSFTDTVSVGVPFVLLATYRNVTTKLNRQTHTRAHVTGTTATTPHCRYANDHKAHGKKIPR